MLKLSVVLATYGRPEVLPKTMDCLRKQDIPPESFEVIIIDDCSPDNTPEVAQALAAEMPFETRFLRNDVNRGASYTQNRGVEAARAPLLLIMADDILLEPGALRAHLESHERHPEEEVSILGNVVTCPEMTERSVFLRKFDPFRYEENWGRMEELPFYAWGAANASIKASLLRKAGMFNSVMGQNGAGPHCHHDVEMAWRLKLQGMRLYFNPDAKGYHHHFYTLESAAQKWRQRGLNWAEFRSYVPDPEFTVASHLLNRRTYREYLAVLRGDNTLEGRERYIAWHLFREAVRRLGFNAVTMRLFWWPLLAAAEKSNAIASLVKPKMYHAFLHYYWNQAVVEAGNFHGDSSGSTVAQSSSPSASS